MTAFQRFEETMPRVMIRNKSRGTKTCDADFAIFYSDPGKPSQDSYSKADTMGQPLRGQCLHRLAEKDYMTSPMSIGQPSENDNDYNKSQDSLPRKGQSSQGSHHPRQQRQLIGAETGNQQTKRANGLRNGFEWAGRDVNTKKGT
jgi:hypothetical protein